MSDVKKLDCDVGSVKLRVKYGDICKERCEAIVNSTNAKLDLSIGESRFAFAVSPSC